MEIATNRPAIVVTLGPIEWMTADEAWVTVTRTRTVVLSAHPGRVVADVRTGFSLKGGDSGAVKSRPRWS